MNERNYSKDVVEVSGASYVHGLEFGWPVTGEEGVFSEVSRTDYIDKRSVDSKLHSKGSFYGRLCRLLEAI